MILFEKHHRRIIRDVVRIHAGCEVFYEFMKYSHKLGFEDEPDYKTCREAFETSLGKHHNYYSHDPYYPYSFHPYPGY